jgi:hypothetical protein
MVDVGADGDDGLRRSWKERRGGKRKDQPGVGPGEIRGGRA